MHELTSGQYDTHHDMSRKPKSASISVLHLMSGGVEIWIPLYSIRKPYHYRIMYSYHHCYVFWLSYIQLY